MESKKCCTFSNQVERENQQENHEKVRVPDPKFLDKEKNEILHESLVSSRDSFVSIVYLTPAA